ncbi:MAG TPA: glucose-6-phosphate dehydrogenase (coenzyme-F420) [Candidatus Dormibacteraeota bacterium]|jgi:coenzyme F420-dependent glucose-6-phosphate dehydrogenase|nr:glucose-6-phosphate dehydrogenase (coenzyme-F420) [Candidatus Dormibacteraeota bacterium]
MLRLGYKASAEQFGPSTLLDFAVEAENQGFESIFVSDHLQPWRHTDGHAPFSFSWLAAAAERTRSVVLGTSVVTPTFRYHPGVVAHAFGTLGELYPGRLILGVGTGEYLNEGALGYEWPPLKERFARLRESIRLIRKLWTEDIVTFDGDYYHTKNATIYDKPSQPVPIYIGASGPQTAKYAGRAGDGFICTSGKGMELYKDSLLPAVEEGEEAAHRAKGSVERMIEVKVSYDHDRNRAMEDTKIWAALALPAEDKAGIDDPREMERRATAVEDVAHRRWLVSGDPDEHIEQLRPYIELGFTHLVFHAPGDDQVRFLREYGRDILPRLRKEFA